MQSGEELAFFKGHSSALASIPISFPDDYQPALADIPKKVQVFPVDIPAPPVISHTSAPSASSSATLTISIKSTKPPLTFALTVQPTDTISQIKSNLAKSHSRAPLPDAQRLLLKGKVLADTKLVKEYDISNDTVITLMSKPGANWSGEERPADVVMSDPEEIVSSNAPLVAPIPVNKARLGTHATHQRSQSSGGAADEMPVPSLVLSPTPTVGEEKQDTSPLSLKLDTDLNTQPDPPRSRTPNTYRAVVSSPAFWHKLLAFFTIEFKSPEDAKGAWEEFFLASKQHLSPHEIALIRDEVGVMAMGGR